MRTWTVDSFGARIAVYEYGDPLAGSTALLVHGYPDDHHVFDPMIRALEQRVRIVAYDTRGGWATTVDDQDSVESYTLARLTEDTFAVVDSIPDRTGPLHVFAHDWGSVQMWETMASPRAATTFASFVSVSGPSLDHLRDLCRARAVSPSQWVSLATQLVRSWYIWSFHVPVLRRFVPAMMASIGSEDAPEPARRNQQRGIALYRANILRRLLSGPDPKCVVPTTVVVPLHDRFLSGDLADGLERWIPDLHVMKVDAEHWWPYTHPVDAAELLLSQDGERAAEQ
ncbi:MULTISPECIES: alpha/beta fold hydrolase [unclassified Rhodococcus (in: high G+C Gram-positive bacteria)]|uniref:alpha/beta fold hydrolase n=1 Tax=unclassified Rhodococcus (in: high G+C Gram-positive bacteria) TaxID=192944 RepID=UPI003397BFE0